MELGVLVRQDDGHAMLLIACSQCSRQYDVTGLEPGRQVRCYCDHLMTVAWPTKLTAAALSCTRCGGAVRVEDEACPYCEAAISESDRRKTTLCPACFTRLEDDSKHCRACSLPIRPQLLHPLPAERGCPRCERTLRVRSLESGDVTECSDCLGLWVTPETFRSVTRSARSKSGDASVAVPSEPTERTLEPVKYIPCLKCGELMQRKQYRWSGRMTGVVIDVCRGHGIWLDHQELERIVQHIATAGEDARLSAVDPPSASAASAAHVPVHIERPRRTWLEHVLQTLVDVLL